MRNVTNPTNVKIMLFAVLLLTINGVMAQINEKSHAHTMNDPSLIWNPAPEFFPGCTFTVLNGALDKPNLDFFFKVEPNTSIIMHTHKSAERMVLVAGEMEVTYEGESPVILKAGTYAYGPANKPHKAKCLDEGPCVLFVAMNEPFDVVPIEN